MRANVLLPDALYLGDERRVVKIIVTSVAAAMRDAVDVAAQRSRQMLIVALVPILAGMNRQAA